VPRLASSYICVCAGYQPHVTSSNTIRVPAAHLASQSGSSNALADAEARSCQTSPTAGILLGTVHAVNNAVRMHRTVNIMCRNIFHDFTLKLTSNEFHSLLKEYEITFVAQTDMLPSEEESANVPNGYVLVSLPRKPRLQNAGCGGGVALLIRDNINFVKSHRRSPDILVLDLGTTWLIGAYIPPVTSRWQGWTDVDPYEQLWESIVLCTRSHNKPVLLLTDLNGRTGSHQASGFEASYPRLSKEKMK
jgi:hypothetical protein